MPPLPIPSPCVVSARPSLNRQRSLSLLLSDWEINTPEGVWDGVFYATCIGGL